MRFIGAIVGYYPSYCNYNVVIIYKNRYKKWNSIYSIRYLCYNISKTIYSLRNTVLIQRKAKLKCEMRWKSIINVSEKMWYLHLRRVNNDWWPKKFLNGNPREDKDEVYRTDHRVRHPTSIYVALKAKLKGHKWIEIRMQHMVKDVKTRSCIVFFKLYNAYIMFYNSAV